MAEQRITEHDRQQRNAKALELHLAGVSYRTIATQLGISVATAHEAVKAGLSDRQGSAGEAVPSSASMVEALEAELARLDAMLVGLWPKARTGKEAAVAQALKIGDQRIRLLTLLEAAKGRGLAPAAPAGEEPVGLVDELKRRRDAKLAGD